jgi:hypothetical protein
MRWKQSTYLNSTAAASLTSRFMNTFIKGTNSHNRSESLPIQGVPVNRNSNQTKKEKSALQFEGSGDAQS